MIQGKIVLKSYALQKMKVGPSRSGYRIRSQTTQESCILRVCVGSVLGKGGTKDSIRCVLRRWTKVNLRCSVKVKDVIETKLLALVWDKVWKKPVYCPSDDRRRGGMSSDTGFCREHGNLSFRCEGRLSSGRPIRDRVPMLSTGADQSVVVMKFAKANGAKGLNHSVRFMRQPRWEEQNE